TSHTIHIHIIPLLPLSLSLYSSYSVSSFKYIFNSQLFTRDYLHLHYSIFSGKYKIFQVFFSSSAFSMSFLVPFTFPGSVPPELIPMTTSSVITTEGK